MDELDDSYWDRVAEGIAPFTCSWCSNIEEWSDAHWPYCSSACAIAAERENELDEAGALTGGNDYDA